MARDDDTQRWEDHKKLIIFLYRHHGLAKTMELMKDSGGFDAKHREYVYRLGDIWGVKKNKSSAKNPAPRPRGPFSDLEELYLCLFPPMAFQAYWIQVEIMAGGEQDIGLLLCCARAVGNEAQARKLAGHIGRHLERFDGDNEEVRSILHILCGYALHHAGHSTQDANCAVEQSVRSLLDVTGGQPKTPYVIDIPRLMLFRYGMEVSGVDQEDLWKNLLGYHVPRLSTPGNEAKCECAVKDCLAWCLPKLSSPCNFPSDVLEVPYCGVDGESARKATAHVFCFLLCQYVAEPAVTDALSRAANQLLQISVCDLLYTLSALILAGPTDAPRLPFDHLCTSPADLMKAAAQRARAVPAGQSLLVFFLNSYAKLTLPTARSFKEQQFMREVCERAKKLVLSVEGGHVGDSEFVNDSMFAVDGFMDEDGP